MRKMKKINGYLVVKFNARELREYEGTALGEYGVIDAELYTGVLDIDRGAMEYDNAGSMEEAVELARGLESELDAEEPEVKVTIVKETDETTEEEEVDAQQMIAGWENTLRGQVASPHYNDVDARTAAHELYGYKAALRDLGLLTREDCFVLPDTFGAWPSPLPRRPEELLSYVCDELCRRRLPEMTQEQLDAVCARCSLERLADEADEAELRIRAGAHRELNGLIDQIRRAESHTQAEQVGADGYRAQLLPEQKAEAVLKLQVQGNGVVMVGDGINDAPALAYADVGISMGSKSTDIAMETSDVIINRDDPMMIPALRRLSRATMRIVHQNFALVIAINSVGLILGAASGISVMMSALLHNSSTILVVANSLRLMFMKPGDGRA